MIDILLASIPRMGQVEEFEIRVSPVSGELNLYHKCKKQIFGGNTDFSGSGLRLVHTVFCWGCGAFPPKAIIDVALLCRVEYIEEMVRDWRIWNDELGVLTWDL
jgi:hypothetical protein